MSEDFEALRKQKTLLLRAQEEREFEEAIKAAGGVDAFLRSRGYDPDEVSKQMAAVAQKAIAEAEAARAERGATIEALLQQGTPEGASLKGRYGGTSLWFDQYGTVMCGRWIVEDHEGVVLLHTPDFAAAFKRWEQEEGGHL